MCLLTRFKLAIIIAFVVLTLPSQCQGQNNRPVIGVLSQPFHDNSTGHYIAASYVKWLESAGARSIPIPYDAPDNLIEEIFTQINGVLFPGGGAPLPESSRKIWELAVQNNDDGIYFPVWGTCLGFEFMAKLASGRDNENHIMRTVNAENISLPLIFPTKEDEINSNGIYSMESQLYPYNSTQRSISSSFNVTMNNHFFSITPETFMSEANITALFKITSTNTDKDGVEFVSTMESFKYPFYATQFHPEKNNFEYGTAFKNSDIPYEVINHSEEAVEFSMKLALFFVGRVRKNDVGRYNLIERHPLIYKYEMIQGEHSFEQIFMIPPAQHWAESDNVDMYDEAKESILIKSHLRRKA